MLEMTLTTILFQPVSVAVATQKKIRPMLEKDPGDVGEELQKRGKGSLGSRENTICDGFEESFCHDCGTVQQPQERVPFQKEQ